MAATPRPRIASGARRTVRALVSVLTALAVVLLTGAVLVAGLAEPAPQAQPVSATRVDIGAGPLHLICPDAPRLSTDEAGVDIDYDAEFGTASEQVRANTGAVVMEAEDARPEQVDIGGLDQDSEQAHSGPEASVYSDDGTSVATVLTAQPAQEHTPLGAAHASVRADAGDLRGLSVSACLPPSTTQWLVGGTSEPGSSARLLLTNAGQTPVTATVDMWGDTGPVESPASVLVPAQESRSLLLETVSQEERLALRVTADGGHLAAAIQDSALAGVVPAGTDMITPGADPSTLASIGPVQVTEVEAQDDPPVLRLVNPATTEATVSVDLLTDDGPTVLAGAQDQVLEAGTVTDISLAGVDPGALAVQVHSDLPVTGSVLRTAVGQAGELDPGEPVRDRAWIGAQDVAERGVLTVPAEVTDTVSVLLANPLAQAQQVQVRAIDPQGTGAEPVTIEISAGSVVELEAEQVPLADVVALEISGEAVLGALMAQGQAEDGPLLAMLTLTPDAAAAQHVDVRLGSS